MLMAETFVRVPCPEVLAALRGRHHAVIEASAGTGKTYALEHLFIELLLGDGARAPIPIDQLLLVTFTEKAVQELRTRCRALLERLVELGEAGPDQADGTYGSTADCPGHCAAFDRAAPCPLGVPGGHCWTLDRAAFDRLRQALLHFDMANISTIHAFCQRTLREEAFGRGALFQEEVVDAARLFDRVFRRCLRREFALGSCRWALERWLSGGRALFVASGDAIAFDRSGTPLAPLLRKVATAGAGLPTQSKQMLRAQMQRGLGRAIRSALDALAERLAAPMPMESVAASAALSPPLAAAQADRPAGSKPVQSAPEASPHQRFAQACADLCHLLGACDGLGEAFAALEALLQDTSEEDLSGAGFLWFNRYFYRALFPAEALPAAGATSPEHLTSAPDFAAVDWPDDPRLGELPDLAAACRLRARIADAQAALEACLEAVGERPAPPALLSALEARRAALCALRQPLERFLQCLPWTLEAGVAAELMPPLMRALGEEKRALGLIDFDDMLVRLDEALGAPLAGAQGARPDSAADAERAAMLRAQLSQRYRALLIDEFQDTDEVQWRIFLKLIGDPARPDPARDPRLVLIGDPKQSIYRFRGADLPTYVAARTALCGEGGSPIRLSTNFRTSPALIQAFNVLFDPEACEGSGAARRGFACERIGGEVRDGVPSPLWAEEIAALDEMRTWAPQRARAWLTLPKNACVSARPRETLDGFEAGAPTARFLCHADYGGSPCVEAGNRRARAVLGGEEAAPLCLFELNPQPRANNKARPGREKLVPQEVFFLALGRLIAAEIERLCHPDARFFFDDGKGRAPHMRPLRLSDVFVLVRDTRLALPAIQKALGERGLPYTSQSGGIFESEEARDLLDLMRAIERPQDRALVRRAALTSFFGLTPEALSEAADGELMRRLSSWRALGEAGRLAELFARIAEESGILRRQLFAARARPLTNASHLFDALLVEIGARPRALGEVIALLDGLIQRRREVEDDGRAKLRALSPPSLGDGAAQTAGDAVQLLTIHAAKGLEAPVVFVMDRIAFKKDPPARPRPARRHAPRSVYVGRDVLDAELDAEEDGAAPEAACDGTLASELRLEEAADAERLLYVAMTRAMVRLYLPALTPQAAVRGAAYARLNERLCALRPAAPRGREAEDAVPMPAAPLPAQLADGATLAPGALQRLEAALRCSAQAEPMPAGARPRALVLTSYTRLAHGPGAGRDASSAISAEGEGAPREEEAAEADAVAAPMPGPEGQLPAGAATGVLVHALFEKLPFEIAAQAKSDEALLSAPAFAALLEREVGASGLELSDQQRLHAAHLVRAALTAPLDIDPAGAPRCLTELAAPPVREMEFLFPIPERSHPRLGAAGQAAGFEVGRGYVKGFVDLAFEHAGRTWIGDWKTDRLPDARPPTLARHVEANYRTQVELYTLAMVRLLGIADRADFERRFGGLLYFFVRAMTGEPMRGVHLIRPRFDEVVGWERSLFAAHFELPAARRFA